MWLVDLVQLACLARQEVVDLSMVAKPSVSGAANIEPEVQSFSLGSTQGRRADRWWSSLYHQHRRPRLDTWQADHGQHLVRDVEAGVVVIAAVVGTDRSNRKIAISTMSASSSSSRIKAARESSNSGEGLLVMVSFSAGCRPQGRVSARTPAWPFANRGDDCFPSPKGGPVCCTCFSACCTCSSTCCTCSSH